MGAAADPPTTPDLRESSNHDDFKDLAVKENIAESLQVLLQPFVVDCICLLPDDPEIFLLDEFTAWKQKQQQQQQPWCRSSQIASEVKKEGLELGYTIPWVPAPKTWVRGDPFSVGPPLSAQDYAQGSGSVLARKIRAKTAKLKEDMLALIEELYFEAFELLLPEAELPDFAEAFLIKWTGAVRKDQTSSASTSACFENQVSNPLQKLSSSSSSLSSSSSFSSSSSAAAEDQKEESACGGAPRESGISEDTGFQAQANIERSDSVVTPEGTAEWHGWARSASPSRASVATVKTQYTLNVSSPGGVTEQSTVVLVEEPVEEAVEQIREENHEAAEAAFEECRSSSSSFVKTFSRQASDTSLGRKSQFTVCVSCPDGIRRTNTLSIVEPERPAEDQEEEDEEEEASSPSGAPADSTGLGTTRGGNLSLPSASSGEAPALMVAAKETADPAMLESQQKVKEEAAGAEGSTGEAGAKAGLSLEEAQPVNTTSTAITAAVLDSEKPVDPAAAVAAAILGEASAEGVEAPENLSMEVTTRKSAESLEVSSSAS